MEKNRVWRRERRTSEQRIAKSISIEGAERKPGGCARKAVGLTSGGLRRVRDDGLRGAARLFECGAGVSRGRSRAVQSDHSSGALAGNGRNGRARRAGNGSVKARTVPLLEGGKWERRVGGVFS